MMVIVGVIFLSNLIVGYILWDVFSGVIPSRNQFIVRYYLLNWNYRKHPQFRVNLLVQVLYDTLTILGQINKYTEWRIIFG